MFDAMNGRALVLLVTVMTVMGCGEPSLQLRPTTLMQSGGDLLLRGEFGGDGVVVLIDGVPAQQVVRESARAIRVRVPSLPRSGAVEVELLFGDGRRIRADTVLTVSALQLDVRPRGLSGLDAE